MRRMVAGLVLVAMLATGCVTVMTPATPATPRPVETATPMPRPAAPRATPRPTARDATITFSGSGDSQTRAFELAGGDYRVAAMVEGDTCFVNMEIRTADNRPIYQDSAEVEFDGPGTGKDATHLYAVAPGRYFLRVIGTCRWSWWISRE